MPRPAPRSLSLPDHESRSEEIAHLAELHGLGLRRAEVLWLLMHGVLSDKELAPAAEMAISTVHGHVQELMEHFGVDKRGRLVIEAIRMEGG